MARPPPPAREVPHLRSGCFPHEGLENGSGSLQWPMKPRFVHKPGQPVWSLRVALTHASLNFSGMRRRGGLDTSDHARLEGPGRCEALREALRDPLSRRVYPSPAHATSSAAAPGSMQPPSSLGRSAKVGRQQRADDGPSALTNDERKRCAAERDLRRFVVHRRLFFVAMVRPVVLAC